MIMVKNCAAEVPPKLVEDVVTMWEGTSNCTIDVTSSPLKAEKITWSKNDQVKSVDSFERITFKKVTEEDTGTYIDQFTLVCYEGKKHKGFAFTFKLEVLCKLP